MKTVEATRDFVAIGQLACRIQQSVRAIEQAADELGIEPAVRINLVVHFDGRQVEQITEHLRRKP